MTNDRIEEELSAAQLVNKMKSGFLDTFFDRKEIELWQAFNNVSIGDRDALENIHHQYKSLNALRLEVQSVVDTGMMAQAEKGALK